MSSADAPPRKKPRNDPLSQQRDRIARLNANPAQALTQATSSQSKSAPAVPDFVNSVQGSSSGAGSGEFHVYKASRRRELERMAEMEAANKNDKDAREFAAKREAQRKADEEKTEKNRLKREKQKLAKQKAFQAEKERKAAAHLAVQNDSSSTTAAV